VYTGQEKLQAALDTPTAAGHAAQAVAADLADETAIVRVVA